ncbi:hypothetical protein J3F83DRAFT_51988 [Trichoderma novae-zelandiae]
MNSALCLKLWCLFCASFFQPRFADSTLVLSSQPASSLRFPSGSPRATFSFFSFCSGCFVIGARGAGNPGWWYA